MSILPRNLQGTLERLATGTYNVTRTSKGSIVNARYIPNPSDPVFQIRAAIQPTSGRDLQRLPEGLRTTQLITIYTNTPLQTALAPSGNIADVVNYGGHSYQCQTVLDWSESGGYNKVIAQKVGQ